MTPQQEEEYLTDVNWDELTDTEKKSKLRKLFRDNRHKVTSTPQGKCPVCKRHYKSGVGYVDHGLSAHGYIPLPIVINS